MCALALLGAAACAGASGSEDATGPSTAPITVAPTTTSTAATTTTTLPLEPTTTTTTAPPAPPAPEVMRQGAEGPFVALLQTRLRDLGFRPGEIDGHYSNATFAAVMAFQKYEGLDADGHAGPITFAALGKGLTGAGPRGGPTPRIEIDVERQIAFAVSGDGTTKIINVSSGSGRRYNSPGGGTALADTPRGNFKIKRRIDGVRTAPLGQLYRPMYFQGGFAIHGATNVPGFPASHGCIRTTNPDQDYLFTNFANGTPIQIYPA
jgi:peptidoglycan hydrolase-like protein with peptidoglycan-binding domain